MRVEKDEWLSGALGTSSWKVSGVGADTPSAQIKAALFDRATQDAGFFSAKIRTSDVGALANATMAGFSVVDVNVTFDFDKATDSASASGNDNMTVEAAGAGDAAAIEQIAAHCFTFSRFHLDPKIGLARANEVKRQWARNACRGRASAVYVVRRKSQVSGFLAVLQSKSDSGTDAIIDLIGVDAARQGQGGGRALSLMFMDQWRARAARLRVGTQICNIRAMRLYESIGFRVAETSYVLHAHVSNGALAA